MTYIDGSGPIAAKLAAVYALRDFKEHREFIRRFCTTQQSQVVGGNAESLIKERSEEHTSELQSLMRISYAVFCLNKKTLRKTCCKPMLQHNTHSHSSRNRLMRTILCDTLDIWNRRAMS